MNKFGPSSEWLKEEERRAKARLAREAGAKANGGGRFGHLDLDAAMGMASASEVPLVRDEGTRQVFSAQGFRALVKRGQI